MINYQPILSCLSEQHTKREHWAPPQALPKNGVNVDQGWTILERRQPLGANYLLDKIVHFLLDFWVENHRKDEIHHHTGCLVMVNIKPSDQILPAYRLSASCRQIIAQLDKNALSCICSPA